MARTNDTIVYRYVQKALLLISEKIGDVREAVTESWTGKLVGGGMAFANTDYNPVTRQLVIESLRPGEAIRVDIEP